MHLTNRAFRDLRYCEECGLLVDGPLAVVGGNGPCSDGTCYICQECLVKALALFPDSIVSTHEGSEFTQYVIHTSHRTESAEMNTNTLNILTLNDGDPQHL